MKRAGLKQDYIRGFLEREFGARVGEVIKAAEKENVILRTFAEKIAGERFRKAKAAAEKRNIISRASNFALELYRRGLIPYQFATPIAAGYFRRKLR
jgi:kynureninase